MSLHRVRSMPTESRTTDEGVADAQALAHRYGGPIAGWRGCIPPSVAGRQMWDIVTQALSEYPEQRRIACRRWRGSRADRLLSLSATRQAGSKAKAW